MLVHQRVSIGFRSGREWDKHPVTLCEFGVWSLCCVPFMTCLSLKKTTSPVPLCGPEVASLKADFHSVSTGCAVMFWQQCLLFHCHQHHGVKSTRWTPQPPQQRAKANALPWIHRSRGRRRWHPHTSKVSLDVSHSYGYVCFCLAMASYG